MRFWLDLGVDGFRLDAIPYLIEREGTSCENLPETHAILQQIRREIDARYPGRVLLAEANQWPSDVRPYFGDGDECHMAFHFPLMPRIYMALQQEDRHPIVEILRQTPDIPESCQWALFLRNHDELTLEMVTDEERDYMYRAYAADPRMRINVGIRRRLAPLLENSRRRIELLHRAAVLAAGHAGDLLRRRDRHGRQHLPRRSQRRAHADAVDRRSQRRLLARRPGAAVRAARSWIPSTAIQAVNVEAQERSPSSLLNWMKRMIALRKQQRVFGRGTIEFVPAGNRKVLAFVRRYDDEVVLCVANLSRTVQPAELDLSAFKGLTPVEMLGQTEFPRIGERAVLPDARRPTRFLLVPAAADARAGHRADDIAGSGGERAGERRRCSSAPCGTRCSTARSGR